MSRRRWWRCVLPASTLGTAAGRGYEWRVRCLSVFNASVVLWALLPAPPAAGQDKRVIDVFGDWSAFAETPRGGKVCYIGSVPKKEEGDYTERGDIYVLVTHRPAEKSLGVVSIRAGYTYRKGSEVDVTVGEHAFKLFTQSGFAWARDSKADRALVAAMKAGATMVVEGTSSYGTLTTDTYSLKGFTAAYQAIGKACGVK